MKAGYYWYFTIMANGKRMETTPDILYYSVERKTVGLIGCDYPLDFNPKIYDVVGKVKPHGR